MMREHVCRMSIYGVSSMESLQMLKSTQHIVLSPTVFGWLKTASQRTRLGTVMVQRFQRAS